MLFQSAAIVAAVLPVAMSLPTYAIPSAFRQFMAMDTCIYPESPYEIQNFTLWTPAPGSNASYTLEFGYVDKSTSIETSCHYNASSPNVAPRPDLTPRYGCDNAYVSFIWQNGTLTMIERACPEATSSRFEAAGAVKPVLDCVPTTCGYTYGDGNFCRATNPALQSNFTSLQPTPH